MTNEERVIAAARGWAQHPSESRSLALVEAVRALEAGTCAESAIGGDPAWPHLYTCNRPMHKDPRHVDPAYGTWTRR